MISESSREKDVTSAAMPGNRALNSTDGPTRQDVESEKERQGTNESNAAVKLDADTTKTSSEASENAIETKQREGRVTNAVIAANGTSNQPGGPTNSQKSLEALRAELKKVMPLKEVTAKKIRRV